MERKVRLALDKFAPLFASMSVAVYFYLMLMSKPPAVVKMLDALASSGGGLGSIAMYYLLPGLLAFFIVFFLSEDRVERHTTAPALAAGFGAMVGYFVNPGPLANQRALGAALCGALFILLFAHGMRHLIRRFPLPEDEAKEVSRESDL